MNGYLELTLQKSLTQISINMGFIIGCIVYVAVCEGICKMMELEEFNKKAWVYAIVGCVGSFLIKAMMS